MTSTIDFERSSFLAGANADFIEELHARYAKDPDAVDPAWRDFFASLADEAPAVLKELEGASWAPRDARVIGAANGAARANGAAGAATAATPDDVRRAAHELDPRADADPLAPGARPPRLQPRSAGPAAGGAAPRARPRDLWVYGGRSRAAHLHRRRAGARHAHFARDHRAGARHLLRPYRRRIHAHPGGRPEGLDPGAHRGDPQPHRVHRARQEDHPRAPHPGRGVRAIPAGQVHRHQALRARGRRGADPRARTDPKARQPARRRRGGDRHAAPRPAQRAGQRDEQAVRRDLLRIPGQLRPPRRCRGLGRREVPSRHLGRPRVRRQEGASVAQRQPVAPGAGRPGGDGPRARQAAPARRPSRPAQGARPPNARRRGIRRPGAGRRDVRALGAARLLDRRDDPFHRQQPDRVHHQPVAGAQVALPVGDGQDRPGADLPRQRRRRGGGAACLPRGDGVQAPVPQGRGHRHVGLSPPRPQRGRRTVLHPAFDVRCHCQAPDDPHALCPGTGRPGADGRGRGQGTGRFVPRPARPGFRGVEDLQAQQGRLAGGRVGGLRAGADGRGPARRDGLAARRRPRDRPRHHARAGGLQPASAARPNPRRTARIDRDGRGNSTGRPPRQSRSAPSWPKATWCACRDRIRRAAPSRSATPH